MPYHHGNLRQALIDAAVELIGELGPHGFSMAQCARRAEVSSGAPYRHFADKDALLIAVAEQAHDKLGAAQQAAMQGIEDPLMRFRAQGLAYVQWAVDNPVHFRVMNLPEVGHPNRSEKLQQAWQANLADARALIADSQMSGSLGPGDPAIVMLAGQAMTYGLARMFVDGQMDWLGIGDDQATAVADAVTLLLGVGLVPRDSSE